MLCTKLSQVHSQQVWLKIILNSVKGTPAHWKQFLYDLFAIVKQLGTPTYFLTLLCTDLRREELPYAINKLNKLDISDEELKNLSYQEWCF